MSAKVFTLDTLASEWLIGDACTVTMYSRIAFAPARMSVRISLHLVPLPPTPPRLRAGAPKAGSQTALCALHDIDPHIHPTVLAKIWLPNSFPHCRLLEMSALVVDTELAGSFLHIAIGIAPSSQRLSTIEEAMLEPQGAFTVPPRRAADIAEFGLAFAPSTCQCLSVIRGKVKTYVMW